MVRARFERHIRNRAGDRYTALFNILQRCGLRMRVPDLLCVAPS